MRFLAGIIGAFIAFWIFFVSGIITMKLTVQYNHLPREDGMNICNESTYDYDLDILHKQTRLIYNMVPKSGSSSIRYILRDLSKQLNYSVREGSYSFRHSIVPFHYNKSIIPKVIEDNDLLSGRNIFFKHFHFIDYSWFGQETPYHINMIRDPVEHLISWYYYQRTHGSTVLGYANRTHLSSEWRNMTFDQCVETDHIECRDSEFTFRMIPFFCGQDEFCLKPSPATLEKAKSNVVRYFPVVGYTDNMQQFFKLCEVIFPQFFKGLNESYYSNINRQKDNVTLHIKQIMTKRMKLEYDFYNWIKQRFHCMYNKYMPQDNDDLSFEKLDTELIQIQA